jgi:hypothetical protein
MIVRLLAVAISAAANPRSLEPDRGHGRRGKGKPPRRRTAPTHGCCPLNSSHDTLGFQFVNVPLGLSFHAQTCSV